MPIVIKSEYVFFVASQVFALSLLWAFVGSNYLLTLSHFSLWVSLALFENLSTAAAMLAFICVLFYGGVAVFLLKTQRCFKANTINCLFNFMIKFVVVLICGLIDLSIYEISSKNKVMVKTAFFASFHAVSLIIQWAVGTTSVHIVVLVIAHIIHWAWYPNTVNFAIAVCVVVAVQLTFDGADTIQNGSLLCTAISCAVANFLSKTDSTI